MTHTLLIAVVLLISLNSSGLAQNRTKDSKDTAKRFMATPDGSGTIRFHGRDGSSVDE
jgi:hypothetical protein